MEQRFDGLEARVDAVDRKVTALDQRVTALDQKVTALDQKVEDFTGGGRLTLALLGEQQRRILDEMREVKDDVRVSTAMVQRLDGTVTGLLNEVRAEHARFDRLDKRLKRLEPEPLI
jgi:chromosome segregation ATPase